MNIGELKALFDDFPDDMEVKFGFGREKGVDRKDWGIGTIFESSHRTDPNNDTGENYLVITT